MKIHILGASGSGTTTLGEALSMELKIPHFDSDDFFWIDTDPPFQERRTPEIRTNLLRNTLRPHDSWILSGSALKWGDFLLKECDMIIYLFLEKEKRIRRLEERERKRFGDQINPGEIMHTNFVDFIEWAKSYDNGDMNMRSRESEMSWLENAECEVLKIEEEMTLEDEINLVIGELKIISC
jgi:adenylate kinase family enzyme